MIRIGLLSDTHGFINEKLYKFFKDCQELWHAGDIGNIETADKLAAFKTLRAVYGNIDGTDVRSVYPKVLRFNCESVDVVMTHIGGYPGHYDNQIKPVLEGTPPNLFICGHSHILKVIYDKKLDFLHINPGAAGKSGLHKVSTAIRFTIDKKDIKDLEILEIPRRKL